MHGGSPKETLTANLHSRSNSAEDLEGKVRSLNQRLTHFQEQNRRQASQRNRNLVRSNKKQRQRRKKEGRGGRATHALSESNRELLEKVERRLSGWGLSSGSSGVGGGGRGGGRRGESELQAAHTEIEHVPLVKDLQELSRFCDDMRKKLIAKCVPMWIPGEIEDVGEGRGGGAAAAAAAAAGPAGETSDTGTDEDRKDELREARESAEKTAAALREAMKQVRNGLFHFGLEAGVFTEENAQ